MQQKSNNIFIRVILFLVGIISLVLGTIGIILPILPTTPFFLLTSYCFMKSSTKFNNWFTSTKMYKKYISGFAEHKAMSITGECILLIFVSIMLIAAMLMVSILPMTICINILLLLKYLYFIFQIKTVSSSELKEIKQKKLELSESV